MSKRMQRNLNRLKALHCCSKSEQKELLRVAKPESINAICDCVHNILQGNVKVDQRELNQLKKKKKILRELTSRKNKTPTRKKILVQHGGGFLNSVLGPVLGVLGEVFL